MLPILNSLGKRTALLHQFGGIFEAISLILSDILEKCSWYTCVDWTFFYLDIE